MREVKHGFVYELSIIVFGGSLFLFMGLGLAPTIRNLKTLCFVLVGLSLIALLYSLYKKHVRTNLQMRFLQKVQFGFLQKRLSLSRAYPLS